MTVYSSAHDLALSISATLRGETARTGGRAVAADTGIDVIDATRIRTSLLGHSTFAESVQMLNDLALLLKQRLNPGQRSISLQSQGAVWVFKP